MLHGVNLSCVVPKGWQPVDMRAYAYYAGKGFDCVRLAVYMERMFASPGADPDVAQKQLLRQHVSAAQGNGMLPIIDLHNYGNCWGSVLGTRGFPIAALADACQQLGGAFPSARINIQNEPVGAAAHYGAYLSEDVIVAAMNASAAAVRATTNRQPAHMSCARWSNRTAFRSGDPNYAMIGRFADILPPVIDIHIYLDTYSRGQEGDLDPTWQDDVQTLIDWHRLNRSKPKFFVGEMGWRPDQNAAGATLVRMIEGAPDVFDGWCYFGDDPARIDYTYRCQPGAEVWDDIATAAQRKLGPYAGRDRPQLAALGL